MHKKRSKVSFNVYGKVKSILKIFGRLSPSLEDNRWFPKPDHRPFIHLSIFLHTDQFLFYFSLITVNQALFMIQVSNAHQHFIDNSLNIAWLPSTHDENCNYEPTYSGVSCIKNI
jgi:hypothetical protein